MSGCLLFTKASQSPTSIPLGIDSPKSPPSRLPPSVAGPAGPPPLYTRSCVHGLRSVWGSSRCTQNPVYTAGQAPRGLMCPVHRILCTRPGKNKWKSRGVSESMKNRSRGVQEVSKSDQEHFFRPQEPSRALQEAFKRLLELIAVSRLLLFRCLLHSCCLSSCAAV